MDTPGLCLQQPFPEPQPLPAGRVFLGFLNQPCWSSHCSWSLSQWNRVGWWWESICSENNIILSDTIDHRIKPGLGSFLLLNLASFMGYAGYLSSFQERSSERSQCPYPSLTPLCSPQYSRLWGYRILSKAPTEPLTHTLRAPVPLWDADHISYLYGLHRGQFSICLTNPQMYKGKTQTSPCALIANL